MIISIFDGGFKPIEISENDIKNFRIVNRTEYTKKGDFKGFAKSFKIELNDNLYTTTEGSIKALKEALKGKYEAEKYTHSQYKGFTEKKATDWTYRMIR